MIHPRYYNAYNSILYNNKDIQKSLSELINAHNTSPNMVPLRNSSRKDHFKESQDLEDDLITEVKALYLMWSKQVSSPVKQKIPFEFLELAKGSLTATQNKESKHEIDYMLEEETESQFDVSFCSPIATKNSNKKTQKYHSKELPMSKCLPSPQRKQNDVQFYKKFRNLTESLLKLSEGDHVFQNHAIDNLSNLHDVIIERNMKKKSIEVDPKHKLVSSNLQTETSSSSKRYKCAHERK